MAKKQRLLFKPTPISRLSKYSSPIKMVGDPAWNWTAGGKASWESRCKRVYAYEMGRRNWPMPWKPEIWEAAWDDNRRIDILLERKWSIDYEEAKHENAIWTHMEAQRDNAAWDYHHDNYIAVSEEAA